jgi:coenzyme A diphosphatase NUDT7
MTTTTTAAAMLARLRAYRPPAPSVYTSMPLWRRAAVLVLLFSDRRGDLRVVLTLRSPTLRTHPGQVALPGGRADFLEETPMATARREAWEEIGLPLDSEEVEELTELPCTTTLAGTYLAVRPCVAFLKDAGKEPKLQEREVQALFTVRLEPFLRRCYGGEEEEWYKGKRFHWNGRNWYGHEFMAPAWEHGKLRRHRVWGWWPLWMRDMGLR